MNTQIHVLTNDMGTLAECAPALLPAPSAEKVIEGIVFGGERKIPGRVREKLIEGAKAADKAVHEYPYASIGIAFSVGALMGGLLAQVCRAARI
jgi:hypothetical protein